MLNIAQRRFVLGLTLVLVSLDSRSARSQEYSGERFLYPWEYSEVRDGIQEANHVSTQIPCGENGRTAIACSKLIDQYCDQVWDGKHEGNMDIPSAKIRLGKSEKSEMLAIKKTDLEALIDSGPRLPADLQQKLQPSLSHLKELMSQEKDSEEWYDAVNLSEIEINDQVKSVARVRTLAKHPELNTIKKSDLSPEQKEFFATDLFDAKNELTKAKYENHPNWQRIVRMFRQAKQDLLAEIETWDLPKDKKQSLLTKVQSVNLQLPSSDPRILFSGPDFKTCSTTMNNAYYYDALRNFTMCAGFFNGIQSDAAIYQTIAHEIGHSIDSIAQASEQFMASPAGKVVDRLCNAAGPVFSCDQWRELKSSALAEPATIAEPFPPFRKLTSCLKPEVDLKPFDTAELKKAAAESAAETMSNPASYHDFTDLAQPEYEKHGKTMPYPYFMRPDRVRALGDSDVNARTYCVAQTSVVREIFTQELSCLSFDPKSALRDQVFKQALVNTRQIETALREKWYSFCGRECRELTSKQLSRATHEDTADWVAKKLMKHYLERLKTTRERQEAVASAFTLFCDANSAYRNAKDLTRVEKEFSLEPHPENRSRALSVYSPEIIDLVKCSPDQGTQKAKGKCEL